MFVVYSESSHYWHRVSSGFLFRHFHWKWRWRYIQKSRHEDFDTCMYVLVNHVIICLDYSLSPHSVLRYHVNKCYFSFNFTHRKKLQWHLGQNTFFPIRKTLNFPWKMITYLYNIFTRIQSMLSNILAYIYEHFSEPVLKNMGGKCLAVIAQMVRGFGMNTKIEGWSPPQVETFSVSKSFDTLTRTSFVCWKWMLLPAHS